MEVIDIINFIDYDSKDEAAAIIRAGEGMVGLALSLKENGDILVVLKSAECDNLIAALQRALKIAQHK